VNIQSLVFEREYLPKSLGILLLKYKKFADKEVIERLLSKIVGE